MLVKGKKGGIFRKGRSHSDTTSKKDQRARREAESNLAHPETDPNSAEGPWSLSQELLRIQNFTETYVGEVAAPVRT